MIIFYPLALLFSLIIFVREMLYKKGIFKSFKVKTKVLSVGNLTFGGTGKTPTVDFLIENLKKKKNIAVLSRGYGRTTKGFYKVGVSDPKATDLYGDEPCLLAKKHPDVPVFVCEDRVEGCRQIEGLGQFDLIIADDAFQHLKLKRDLDIVVVDATEKKANYQYPPIGRARNSFFYLNRADFVFLTKVNLVREDSLRWIKRKLTKNVVIEFESRIDGLYSLNNDRQKNDQRLEMFPKEVYLVSGIGKPAGFEDLVKKCFFGVVIKEHFIYKDHHDYTLKDIQKLKSKIGSGILLTTEKDAVKLKKFSDVININVARLKFDNKTSMESLYEALH
jgi:tetraacyldisaccharide 4'-kinase